MSSTSIQPPGKLNPSTQRIWQGDRARDGALLPMLWLRLKQLFWGALLIAALGLFVWLIWLLLLAPKRTPFVVLTAAPYSWPLPPNAMAHEDFEKLSAMDHETITMRGVDRPVLKAEDFFARLDQEIQTISSASSRIPMIVWVSLHGVAEPEGQSIHLIPPDASPTDRNSWIDLEQLVDRLNAITPQRNVLLVLDCNRMQVNWNIGLLANGFAERVQVAIRQRTESGELSDHLAVLLTSGIDQSSAISADLGGSVFGHSFQLGLAGDADRSATTGNSDGWVDVQELFRYVASRVQSWSTSCRGKSQTPVLLSAAEQPSFRLVRSLNKQQLTELTNRQVSSRQGTLIAAARLDSLWRSLDDLRGKQLYQAEPIAFRDLEHDLLWLEQLANAGQGYRTLAQRTLDRVQARFRSIDERLATLEQQRTFIDRHSIISGSRPDLPRGMRVHSLPLAQYFGLEEVSTGVQLRNQLQSFANQPNPQRLSQVRREFEEKSRSEYSITQLFQMIDRYQSPEIWNQSESLGDLIKRHSAIEDLASPRDTIGMPSDLRAHHWNRSLIRAIDLSRRIAEDQLFLKVTDRIAESSSVTESLYQQSLAATEQVAKSLSICDTAFAVTPYYAQWILHPDRVWDERETLDATENKLVPLIQSSGQLATQLAGMDHQGADHAAVTAAIDRIHRFANDQVESALATLANDWKSRQRRLMIETSANQIAAIGESRALLSLPLIDWSSRSELRNAVVALETRIHQSFEPWTEQPQEIAEGSEFGYSVAIRLLPVHPFDLLVSLDGQTAEQSAPIRIAAFCDSIDDQTRAWRSAGSIAVKQKQCRETANRIRAAAGIWLPPMESDPLRDQLMLDLESLLIWHCDRVLTDCWGPAGDSRAFFDLAASDYLSTVTEMDRRLNGPGMNASGSAEVRDAKSRLEELRRMMPNWMMMTAERAIQLDAADDVMLKLKVTTVDDGSVLAPNGTATLMVRSESGRVDLGHTLPTAAVTLPSHDAPFSARLPAAVTRSGSSLKAMSVFRGHEYASALDLELLNGVTIDLKPYRYEKSEVTLNGPWDTLSVVFVIDCSASMGDPVGGSAGSEVDGSLPRLEVAKVAIQEMLFHLGMRRNVRVGVLAFGNRIGWTVDEPVRSLTRPDYVGLIDPSLTPEQDVEAIYALSDFDLSAAKGLVPAIGDLKPWGQSPLYLSVAQAIQNFSAADSNAERHVIVITDGANYQFMPPTDQQTAPTTDDDVRQVWTQNQVPVHILGFGMDQGQQRAASVAFDRLSRDTGGRFHSLTRSTDLARVLRDLLVPGSYQLLSYQRDQQPEISTSLGTPTQVIPAPRQPELFGLQYEGRSSLDGGTVSGNPLRPATEPIVLEGGEAYQLYVDHAGTEIYDFPFDENVAVITDLVGVDQSPSDHAVRIHRPSRGANGQVLLLISWQRREPAIQSGNALWRATRRPSDVWIQLQPIGSNGNPLGQDYVFYDTVFEPSQPVPVMNLIANDWPKDAVKAKISLWSQPPQEESTIELLPPALDSGSRPSSDRWTTTVPQTNFEEHSGTVAVPVSVVESVTLSMDPIGTRFDDGISKRRYVIQSNNPAIPVSTIKLDVDGATSERLTRVVRQYDSARGISVHTFYYESRNNESPSEIVVSNQAYETENAWRLDGGFVEIAIPDSGGLLPVGRVIAR